MLPFDSRHREPAAGVHRTLCSIGGQRTIWCTLGFAKNKNRWHQNITGIFDACGQHHVRIQRRFSLGNHFGQLRQLFIGSDRSGYRVNRGLHVGAQQVLDLTDEWQPTIHLRFEEKGRVDDRFDLCGRQLINQPRMNIARPWPAANIGNALVVNGNDHHLVGRPAVCTGAGHVIKTALQTTDQVG